MAAQLRVSALNMLSGDRFAVSAGIGGATSMLSVAKPGVPRSSASLAFGSGEPVRFLPARVSVIGSLRWEQTMSPERPRAPCWRRSVPDPALLLFLRQSFTETSR